MTTKDSNVAAIFAIKSCKWGWSAAIAFAALIGGKLPAQAANFNFTYAPGTSLVDSGKDWLLHVFGDLS